MHVLICLVRVVMAYAYYLECISLHSYGDVCACVYGCVMFFESRAIFQTGTFSIKTIKAKGSFNPTVKGGKPDLGYYHYSARLRTVFSEDFD